MRNEADTDALRQQSVEPIALDVTNADQTAAAAEPVSCIPHWAL